MSPSTSTCTDVSTLRFASGPFPCDILDESEYLVGIDTMTIVINVDTASATGSSISDIVYGRGRASI